MNARTYKVSLLSALFALSAGSTSCGTLDQFASSSKEEIESIDDASDTETSNLIEASMSAASGSEEPSLRPFRMDGLGQKGGHKKGKKHGRGHQHGRHSEKEHRPVIPAEIQSILKAADAKKDAVLGIDRVKVDEILAAMKTDLSTLRAVSASREEFKSQAKIIQDKYSEQLRAILPSFDSLSQEQKDRVKAIHDLQKGVMEACVREDADAASDACTAAKSSLQGNIDTP